MDISTPLRQLSDGLASLAAGAHRSLVEIHNGHAGVGAGSVWHADGLIVTNAHVASSRDLRVTLSDGRELPARVLASDKHLDLAALAVDEHGLPAMTIGDSRRLKPGQILLAAGHPWGVLGAVTSGVFIGHESSRGRRERGREWLVTDLKLRPGNSGGPMFDADGEMVGVSTMITGPDVAMAVPVHVAKGFLQEALRAEQAAA